MSCYFVTGAAGFIGSKVCEFLLRDGHQVVGIDNFDPVYDLRMKEWRLNRFKDHPAFSFYKESICDRGHTGQDRQSPPQNGRHYQPGGQGGRARFRQRSLVIL